MELKDIYSEIANRSILSAELSRDGSYNESAGFLAYHAFESIGGALCSSHRMIYSKSHVRKINQFLAVTRRKPYRLSVAYLGILLSSFRNKCLYPDELSDGGYKRPSDFITLTNVNLILRRVKGIIKKIEREI